MLNKKTAIVTGCNGSLGTFFCKKLIEKNYSVIGLDLQKKSLQKDIIYKRLDISNFDQVKIFFKRLKKIDILFNNAGIGVYTSCEKRTKTEIKKVVDTNLLGTLYVSLETLKKMKNRKKGKIINIASIYGVVSSDKNVYGSSSRNNSEVYSATKAAVIMLTKYLASYYADKNIQINCISPGGVFNFQEKNFVKNYSKKTPIGRMMKLNDFNAIFEFLISENNNYFVGQNLIIDGGYSSI